MNRIPREEGLQQTMCWNNTKEQEFRISNHAKTLNCLATYEARNCQTAGKQKGVANGNYSQLGAKLHSTQLSSSNNQRKRDLIIEHLQTIDQSPTRVASISSKYSARTPETKKCKSNWKAKTEKNTAKHGDEIQKDVQVRLSLTTFHQKLKTSHMPHQSKEVEGNHEFLNLKLEGITYTFNYTDPAYKKYSINSPHRKGQPQLIVVNTPHSKKTIRISNEEQSNLNQFNRILSKMKLEEEDHFEDAPELDVKKLPAKNRRIVAHLAQASRKNPQNKHKEEREHAKVNVINIAESKPFQEKPRCHQIYMKYFLKSEDCCAFERNEPNPPKRPLTQSELMRQLREIKKEIAQHSAAKERKPAAPEERFTKYTTSFIEEKLTRRKSLIKSYTFRKGALESHNRNEDASLQEFCVDGWHSQEADRAEAISS